MRRLAVPLAAALTLLGAAAAPTPVDAHYYPWCAHYTGADYGSAISCGYMTRAQCMATVSGVGGYCEENFPQPRAPAPARKAAKPAPR